MPTKKYLYSRASNDAIKTFFEDVAQISIIGGQEDYLPLTRKIRREEVLASLGQGTHEDIFKHLMEKLENQIHHLGDSLSEKGLKSYDIQKLSTEIEVYLENPQVTTPPSFSKTIDQLDEDTIIQALDVLFLFSLIPQQERSEFPYISYSNNVQVHFDMIRQEAANARNQLVQGTLRYIINMAISPTFLRSGLDYLDIVQEGFFGLMRAMSGGYDERAGHLQLYASTWIWQRITRGIADTANFIRLPVHQQDKLSKIDKFYREIQGKYGRIPYQAEVVDFLEGVMPHEDTDEIDEEESEDRSNKNSNASWQKAVEQIYYFQMGTIPPYSIDNFEVMLSDVEDVDLANFLVDDDQLEQEIDFNSLKDVLHELLSKFNERDRYILEMRYGLADGEEHTLEEIGQVLGITRERVRQIEARCLKAIAQSSSLDKLRVFWDTDPSRAAQTHSIQQYQRSRLLKVLDRDLFTYPIDDDVEIQNMTSKIQRLIDKYVERARPREMYIRQGKSRRMLFVEILQALGKPSHYSLIHKIALDKLEGVYFPKQQVYTILFYSDNNFRSYGNGVFGLTSWDEQYSSEKGAKIFQYCPEPLLPVNTFPTSFFESIMVGRDLLSRRTLTVKQFLDEMVIWANRGDISEQQIQVFFDAWYVAGFCELIRFPLDGGKTMETMIPPDAKLNEVRQHCLNALCQRVAKMPEMLLALERIPRPTVGVLEKVLYGSKQMGFDISARLTLLASFDAIKAVGNEWRLTELGRVLLASYPSEEVPDFSEYEIIVDDLEDASWQDDLGLLDF